MTRHGVAAVGRAPSHAQIKEEATAALAQGRQFLAELLYGLNIDRSRNLGDFIEECSGMHVLSARDAARL